uniref:Rab proteins geranylgeranyltransferase component A n=1 Tax=Caenorhabditis japonica TaxID=281687 RepID=A0A8R1E329_CAEJA
MDEKLPESVDVIVLGTGLPEAVLASACARAGLSVLHLDRNEYYGGEWSSFTMSMIHEVNQKAPNTLTPDQKSQITELLEEDEQLVELGHQKVLSEVEMKWLQDDVKEKLEKESQMRRFSIDLVPKVLLSKGAMVQTLCDSQVSHYAEFKLINRQLCPTTSSSDGHITLNSVPCSKGEIFQNSALSILEKRALMKFITFCTQWRGKPDAERRELLGAHADRPFGEFLKEMGVGETLQEFIINTIGILQPRPTAMTGMLASCEFMDSVGHFGPSPFLFPLYGCGELAQCFCRLAAVFGSLYCLGRPVQAMIKKDGRVIAIIANNERINCRHVIMSARFVPEDVPILETSEIERIVYATDKSIKEAQKEQLTLINLASLRPEAAISRIVEVGFEACTAPKGHFLVHATGTREGETSIEKVAGQILAINNVQPYWKMSFTGKTLKFDTTAGELAENVILAPQVDASLHYSHVVEECREIFCKNWPDLDFLPRTIKNDEENEEEVEKTATGEENQVEN